MKRSRTCCSCCTARSSQCEYIKNGTMERRISMKRAFVSRHERSWFVASNFNSLPYKMSNYCWRKKEKRFLTLKSLDKFSDESTMKKLDSFNTCDIIILLPYIICLLMKWILLKIVFIKNRERKRERSGMKRSRNVSWK